MKINFKEIVLLDIDGKPAKAETPIHKAIANIIYTQISNLDLVEVAREINKGKVVELSNTDIKQIKKLLLGDKSGLFAFAKAAITEFFEALKQKG